MTISLPISNEKPIKQLSKNIKEKTTIVLTLIKISQLRREFYEY